jgi:hypothetical protein
MRQLRRQYQITKYRLLGLGLLMGVCLSFLAVTASTVNADSQAFSLLKGQAQIGMLMSLTPYQGVIQYANTSNSSSLVGVVTPADQTNLSAQSGQVSVATSGATNALVSTVDGDIAVGDLITVSPLNGVGAKLTGSGWIVGVAQGSLDSQTKGALNSTVTDSTGHSHAVQIASIPIVVKVTYFSHTTAVARQSSWVPSFIQNIANSLAAKHASTTAIVLSFTLFFAGLIATVAIVQSAIREGFQAIGRQPLARHAILRQQGQLIALALGIVLFVVVAGVLILRFE